MKIVNNERRGAGGLSQWCKHLPVRMAFLCNDVNFGHTRAVRGCLSSIRACALLYWQEIVLNNSIFFPLHRSPPPRIWVSGTPTSMKETTVTFPPYLASWGRFRAWSKKASMGWFFSQQDEFIELIVCLWTGWRHRVSVTLAGKQKTSGYFRIALYGSNGNSKQYEIFK